MIGEYSKLTLTPLGFCVVLPKGVATKAVKTIEMYKGVIPFIALQLVGLAIVGVNPSLVNYLPTKTFLSSETAPAKKSRLQLCLEDYYSIFTTLMKMLFRTGCFAQKS